MQKSFKILIVLFVLLVIGYYFWAWPLFVLQHGWVDGTTQYVTCMTTRGKNMPVEFSYPQNGAQNVPIHSSVVIKLKESNKHIISSSSISYAERASSPLAVPMSASAEYFIAGNFFPEDAFTINPNSPEEFSDIDIIGKTQEFEGYVKTAGSDMKRLASYRTDGAWEPGQAITVQISAACYNPYRLEFQTGQE